MEERKEEASDEKKDDNPFKMTKEQIDELPISGFKGRITVVNTPESAERAASALRRHRILGFDTETKPNFRKGQKQNPIALIQLSAESHAFLFRVVKTGMTPGLKSVLESPDILKIGQALKHELATMKKELGVAGRGFIDLLDIGHTLGFEPKSVKGVAAIFLRIRISKSMQVTNWEREYLSSKQLRYAATDAWACLEIYRVLGRKGLLEKVKTNRHR